MTIKTNRDFLTAVAALSGIDTAITDFAKTALAGLDEKNAKRKLTKSALAHKAEVDGFRADVLALFTADSTLMMTAAEVGAKLGVSTPKASSALTALATDGELTKTEIKIHACKAQGVKGGKKMAYKLAPVAEDNGAE